MEERQITNDTVFVSAVEPPLTSGCDPTLYYALIGVTGICGICLYSILPNLRLKALGVAGVFLIFHLARWGLREMAKSDPLLVRVYLRHIQWPDWLPATGLMVKRRPMKLLRRRT